MNYLNYQKRIITCYIFLLLSWQIAIAQSIEETNLLDSIPVWMAKSNVPVIGVGIIKNDKIKVLKVLGHLDGGKQAPMNTIFNVASLTKPVTTLTVLKLINQGKITLDEPLYPYWIDPDLSGDIRYKNLTTRLILSHQTGFPNWRADTLKFIFEPGTRFGYSGEGFEYLRRATEAKLHEDLQQLANTVIFKPLGLKDTRYGWNIALDSTRFANPHDTNGKRIYSTKIQQTNAADWLVTTIHDYTVFGLYFLKGAGLSKSLFKEVISPQISIKSSSKETMGLGWEVIQHLESGGYLLMHTGQDNGVNSLIVLLPESGKGMVLLSNSDNGFDVMKIILKKYLHIKEITP